VHVRWVSCWARYPARHHLHQFSQASLSSELRYSSRLMLPYNHSWTSLMAGKCFTRSAVIIIVVILCCDMLYVMLSCHVMSFPIINHIIYPAYLRELFSQCQPSRSLRSSNQLLLTVPRANLTPGQRAFSYSSPVIWNVIPLSVRDAPSISTFKRRLKSFYFLSSVC